MYAVVLDKPIFRPTNFVFNRGSLACAYSFASFTSNTVLDLLDFYSKQFMSLLIYPLRFI